MDDQLIIPHRAVEVEIGPPREVQCVSEQDGVGHLLWGYTIELNEVYTPSVLPLQLKATPAITTTSVTVLTASHTCLFQGRVSARAAFPGCTQTCLSGHIALKGGQGRSL